MKLISTFAAILISVLVTPALHAEYDAESAAISGYGYGYEEIQTSEQSNLFLGTSDGSRVTGAYPIDRNNYLNEVPEQPKVEENIFGSYESSVNSFLDQKVSPQDDPSRVMEQYQSLQADFWDHRGGVRLRAGKTR